MFIPEWHWAAVMPKEEALDVLDEVLQHDMSQIRNRAGYIVGMIRTRERAVAKVCGHSAGVRRRSSAAPQKPCRRRGKVSLGRRPNAFGIWQLP